MKIAWVCLATYLVAVVAVPHNTTARSVPAPVNVHQVSEGPKTRVYIQSSTADEKRVLALRRHLIDRGADHVNLFLPSLIVCEVPARMDVGEWIDDPTFRYFSDTRGAAAVSAAEPLVRDVADAYRLAADMAQDVAFPPEAADFDDVVLRVPDEAKAEYRRQMEAASPAGAAPPFRNIDQNAEFMAGDILVQLVYPESDGGVDSNQETWKDSELRVANQGAVAAMLAFQQIYAYVPMSFVFWRAERVRTVYEPILHTMDTDDTTWIPDVMTTLGHGNAKSAMIAAHEYNNKNRARFGTDWVYTAFIGNSRNQPGHIFGGQFGGAGYTAYANLGGPYLVIPFPAGANDPNGLGELELFSQIFQHETVHIFWGLDEYVSAPSDCSSHTGYLDYQNMNKLSIPPGGGAVQGCPNFVTCVMWDARGVEGRKMCRFTAGQIGTIDANENGVPDVFDSMPTIEFAIPGQETVREPDLTIDLKAISLPVMNRNPSQDRLTQKHYAAPLKDVTFSINGVGATRLKPVDGRVDEIEEDLQLHLGSLSAGLTKVVFRARNRFGRSSGDVVKRIFFAGLKYGAFNVAVDPKGIAVRWNLIGETFGAQLDLYRTMVGSHSAPILLSSSVEPAEDLDPSDPFVPYEYYDNNVEAGQEYSYIVKGRFSLAINGVIEEIKSNSEPFSTRAMLPIRSGQLLSNISPNPFRDATTFSIDVPPSFSKGAGDVGGQGSFEQEVRTAVEVSVYDVTGRRVKQLVVRSVFGGIETVRWDGTNTRNDRVASGIYFLRASAGSLTEVRKVVLVR